MKHETYVEISFSSLVGRSAFNDDDYQFFGDGDIGRGKRNVEAAIQKLADRIDDLVRERLTLDQ